jgi:hypothetical protein
MQSFDIRQGLLYTKLDRLKPVRKRPFCWISAAGDDFHP